MKQAYNNFRSFPSAFWNGTVPLKTNNYELNCDTAQLEVELDVDLQQASEPGSIFWRKNNRNSSHAQFPSTRTVIRSFVWSHSVYYGTTTKCPK